MPGEARQCNTKLRVSFPRSDRPTRGGDPARGDLWQLVAFTLLLGASQGVIIIVRGAVPLALFGTQGFGTVLGLIATPILLVNAFSPSAFALLVDWFGWQTSLYALFGCSLVTWMAMELMSRWYERAQVRARSHLATET